MPGRRSFLILAGPNDGFHADVAGIREAIRQSGTGELVRWAGFLPDATLRHLHSGAVALLLVSASEGFGLPAVEAASCGTPVIATTESPLPQLLEGGGIFVNPGDVEALTAAIERLAGDEPGRPRDGRSRTDASPAVELDEGRARGAGRPGRSSRSASEGGVNGNVQSDSGSGGDSAGLQ
jgi:glycosyltransferase involved in cell wall biosynthesis